MVVSDLKAIALSIDIQVRIPDDMGVVPNRNHTYPCPFHNDGGTPNLKVYKNGYHCFACKESGDALDWIAFWTKRPLAEVITEHGGDPKANEERRAEIQRRQDEHDKQRAQDIRTKVMDLRESKVWETYHLQLEAHHVAQWLAAGIPSWYIKALELGADTRQWHFGGEPYECDSLTIPVRNIAGQITNLQHRLLADKGPRYVSVPTGVPTGLFFANPDLTRNETVYLLEGAKKAMVFFLTLKDKTATVVGSLSKNLSEYNIKQLAFAKKVVYIPDPDLTQHDIKAVRKALDKKDCYVIAFPDKFDDLAIRTKMTKEILRGYINNSLVPWRLK